jgi:hypothetical protein
MLREKLDGYRIRLDELKGKVVLLQPLMVCGNLMAVTPTNAPQYLQWSSNGFGVASLYYSWTLELYGRIDAALDLSRSIAFLDKASSHLGDTKDSAAARGQYVSKDPEVLEALEMRAEAEGLMNFYKSKAQEFRMNHEAVKKIVYGDSFGVEN